jgi:antitoxin (DNA-binding transcriptional repressor) of toxin-antitoxin stability system
MEMNATELRRQMLSLLDHLPEEGIVITKRGLPVAEIKPIRQARKGRYIRGPFIEGKGQPGPLCPTTETPYDLIFD